MISYELAKQLKEAGYPQTSKDGRWNLAPYIYPVGLNSGGVHAPTLSELIEACHSYASTFALEQDYLMDGLGITNEHEWTAVMHTNKEGYFYGEGSTPEEAVANLWISLNTK